jgi:hypothetical protein
MLQPKKPVVKKTVTAKPKSVSERIGNITLRDVKNAGEDALNLATVGLYSRGKRALGGEYKYKKLGEKKNGGKVTKAKNGKSFPDLNKDGKITKADVLKGRGVIAKKGAVIKKAQGGTKVVKGSRPGMGVFRTTKERTTSGGVTEPYKYKTESIDTTGYSKGRNNYKVKTVEGEGDKTRSKVTSTKSKVISRKDVPSTLKSLNKAKTGGSMKKCKGGC